MVKRAWLFSSTRKVYAPPTLQLGFEADGSEPKDVTFTLAGRLTFLEHGRLPVRMANRLSSSATTTASTSELYRPFNAPQQMVLCAPHQRQQYGIQVLQSDRSHRFVPLPSRRMAAFDAGYGFDRFTELRVGYQIGYSDIILNLGTATLCVRQRPRRRHPHPFPHRPHRRPHRSARWLQSRRRLSAGMTLTPAPATAFRRWRLASRTFSASAAKARSSSLRRGEPPLAFTT